MLSAVAPSDQQKVEIQQQVRLTVLVADRRLGCAQGLVEIDAVEEKGQSQRRGELGASGIQVIGTHRVDLGRATRHGLVLIEAEPDQTFDAARLVVRYPWATPASTTPRQ